MKSAHITLELTGKTLERLLYLSQRLHRHPNELTVDLLQAAIEVSVDNEEAQLALMTKPSLEMH
ncbi:hypothetical protein JWJ90_07520 [Desulfobulbus rhabdoformis]|uniref:hypothetical protein n=1 Tax=Desulfobulbus rhabdoformis TaxID=34032 RepID=UPI001966A49B|nr:hypothetical protein [Desulfobulbus rhabdoformis]MBM9614135.1 hypothetical protein [Desulfobulbus rhabdoformis]